MVGDALCLLSVRRSLVSQLVLDEGRRRGRGGREGRTSDGCEGWSRQSLVEERRRGGGSVARWLGEEDGFRPMTQLDTDHIWSDLAFQELGFGGSPWEFIFNPCLSTRVIREARTTFSCSVFSMAVESEARFHVLAVDDSVMDRKLIEKLLKISSFHVTTVDSGSKALEFLGLSATASPEQSEIEVNLIITDYSMPGMTGYDLLKRIKGSSSFKDIPVVIMSAENMPSRINRKFALSCAATDAWKEEQMSSFSSQKAMDEESALERRRLRLSCGGLQYDLA
ncbi:hypothetical protein ZIOFF_053628 [Zingiber officinale]|uniref:Response regulatory domain-containing protein n=1 Tax=Zingiber officinale TaxID=94328 RepID=A0A8J5F894_ZINOF|nr:hypothetical protein ZIOFF_053628 [Zingiber officinale]